MNQGQSSISPLEAVQHYEQRQTEALRVLEKTATLRLHIQQTLKKVDSQLDSARRTLANAYMLRFDAATVQEVEKRTGYRGFSRRDPFKALNHEKRSLERAIEQVQQDERYRRRAFLVGPNGERTREWEEAKALLEPWDHECASFEQRDGFTELVDVGYDTPAHQESWLSSSYWKHWAQGDKICEALGMDDFGDDVLPAYEKARREQDKWRTEVSRLNRRVSEVHGLVQKHDQAVARIPQLESIYLEQCQQTLAEFLDGADLPLLEEWSGEDGGKTRDQRGILMSLRRVAGLKAKKSYLEEMLGLGLDPMVADLRMRLSKYQRKSEKYARPKMVGSRIPREHMDNKFAEKHQKLLERLDKTGKLVERMAGYDDYGGFGLDNDSALWWLEFTGKKPTRLLPASRNWYDRNPTLGVAHDSMAGDAVAEAVAQAAAARGLDDIGYIS